MATDVKNDANLSTNLVSYWEFEESTGTRVDSHGGNDLTANGSPTSGTGKQGNCLDLEESSNQYLNITDASQTGLGPSGSMSIAAWVNLESNPPNNDQAVICAKWGGSGQQAYIFDVVDSGGTEYFRFAHRDLSATFHNLLSTTTNPSTATWYHVVATFDASTTTGKIYINGSLDATDTTFGSSVDGSNADFTVGQYLNTFHWDGLIDELGFWSKALSSTEVSDLYNAGSGIPYDAGGGGGGGSVFSQAVVIM